MCRIVGWARRHLGRGKYGLRPPFRASKYIDFNAGKVLTAPMDLKKGKAKPWSLSDKIDLFECRVEVWQLGVAVAMLRQIEANQSPSVWSHAAYGVVAVAFSYFEMLGKTLNPAPHPTKAGEDFNWGFADVYPSFKPASNVYTDKLPVPAGPHPPNPDVAEIVAFRDRIRNGMYHLGYTKNGVWLHDDDGCTRDFEITQELDHDNPSQTITRYRVNPHRMVRTIVSHFPGFMTRVRNNANNMQSKFLDFFEVYHLA